MEKLVRAWHLHKQEPEKEIAPPPAPAVPSIPDRQALQLRNIADRLRSHLSTQVSIRYKPNGYGKIEISYYSSDDLERLLELLMSK